MESLYKPPEHGNNEIRPSFTMITFNAGLLRVHCCGCPVYAYPAYANERFPHILDGLKQYDADVIALQEVFEEDHADSIYIELKNIYPHRARVHSGDKHLKFHNGLMVLSKYEIVSCYLMPYEKVSLLESWMATKSSLIVDIDVPELGKITLINSHTTAGGFDSPDDAHVDDDRQAELQQIADAADLAIKNNRLPIILGDLNCGPDLSSGNFDYIVSRGYRDTYVEAQQNGSVNPKSPTCTWDAANYMNKIGPHAHTPPQRMDHILLPGKGMEDWCVTDVTIFLHETIAEAEEGKLKLTPSDHHALLVKIERCKIV